MDPTKEEERAYYALRLMQVQSEELRRQLAALQQAYVEAQAAHATLSAITQAGKEALLPIGSGVLAKAKGLEKTVLVEQGAGVYAENESEQALKTVSERAEKLAEAARQTAAELEELEKAARETAGKLKR